MRLIAVLTFLLCCRLAGAQPVTYYPSYKGTAITQGSDSLHTPWSGGLLNPQFSEMDLNQDGQKDLVVFEPMDNQLLTFIYDGYSQYHYAPEYQQGFPRGLRWVLLRDYDNDGKEDLFTYSSLEAGMDVYRNVSEGRQIRFQLVARQLQYQDNNFRLNLYVPSSDIPVITDMDNDGDLDILAFDVVQYYVQYYVNQSMEKYHTADSLDFNIESRAWGKFAVSASDYTVILGAVKRKAHGGSNMLVQDFDADGDKDLLLADITYPGLMYLENGRVRSGKPSLAVDSVVAVDTVWPSQATRAYIPYFPASFSIDVDHDGLLDVLISPQQLYNSWDQGQVFYYRNTGTAQKPAYTLIQKDFLQHAMLDEGMHNAPALYDLNGDGATDMVVATKGNIEGPYAYDRLVYYLNTGSNKEPIMKRMSDDFAGALQRQEGYLRPCFGDLDGDGLADMLVGKQDGKILFYKNTGVQGSIPQMQLVSDTYGNVNVEGYSAPYLADLDQDGLLDLVVGKEDGTISYYHNTGSKTQADFSLVTDSLGHVRTNRYYYEYMYDNNGEVYDSVLRMEAFGASCPVVADLDRNGKLDLLSGSLRMGLFFYFDIEDKLNSTFTRTDSLIYNHIFGNREPGSMGLFAIPAVGMLGKDSLPDLIVGNLRGGAYYFGSEVDPTGIRPQQTLLPALKVYPNPASHLLTVESGGVRLKSIALLNIMGQTVMGYSPVRDNVFQLDVSGVPPGIYFLQLSLPDGDFATRKVVIRH